MKITIDIDRICFIFILTSPDMLVFSPSPTGFIFPASRANKGNENKMDTVEIDLKTICAISKCAASNEQNRPYLEGVYLEGYEDHIIAVATNGHKMLVSRMDVETNTIKFKCVIPSKALDIFKFDEFEKGTALFSFDDGSIKIEYDILTVISPPLNGNFPDFKKIIPVSGYDIEPAQFDPNYLLDFEVFSNVIDGGHVTVSPNGSSAALVRFKHTDETFGVIMPLHVDFLAKTPDWFEGESAKTPPVSEGS